MPDPLDPPAAAGPGPAPELTGSLSGHTHPDPAADDDDWSPPGRLGPYRLLDPLGRGGMGLVYRAEDTVLGREVAVKVMRPAAARAGGRVRFLREARAQAKLDHDHVVPIYAADEADGVPYLVMPVLRGRTLAARLKAGRPPLAEVVRIAREAAAGVAAAHAAGLVHRDIKPANIWVDDGGRVRLMDFGLARPGDGPGDTWTGAVIGTPAYMAPEQTRGEPADDRVDLFGLGCVLYEMAAGRRPFVGGDPAAVLAAVREADPPDVRSLNRRVPPALAALIRSLLAKDPAGRPASAAAVADALRAIEAGPARLRRRVGAAAAAVAVLLLAVVVARAVRPGPDPTPVAQTPTTPPAPGSPDPVPAAGPFPPLDPVWLGRTRGLARTAQAEAVRQELIRRNPRFDGRMDFFPFDDGRKVKIELRTDGVTDLSPVQAVPGLEAMECHSPTYQVRGRLESLEPLRGLPLWQAGFAQNPVRDLSPLAGMPLRRLWIGGNEATDFEPIYGLRHLRVLHLTSLAAGARVDVGRLVGLPLEDVWLDPAQCRDYHRLKEIPTLELVRNEPAAVYWREYDAGRR